MVNPKIKISNQFTAEDIAKFKALFAILTDAPQVKEITLNDFSLEYLQHIENNLSPSYYSSIKLSYNHLFKFIEPQTILSNITVKDAQDFTNYLTRKVKRGYRVYYRNLRAAFTMAVTWNFVRENVFNKIQLPKQQKRAPEYLTVNELEIILSNMNQPHIRESIEFCFYTGLRLNELTHLAWQNIHLAERIIIIGDDQFITKNRKQRIIPLCERAFEILSKNIPKIVRKDRHVVFSKEDGSPFTKDYFSRSFKRAVRKAGLDERYRFHSLRHSFASNLVQKGVSIFEVKELLGHSSVATTEIYSHLNLNTLKTAVSKFDSQKQQRFQSGGDFL